MHKLKEYLIKKNITYDAFSLMTRLHPRTIWNVLVNKPINLKTAKRLVKVTKGELTLSDFRVSKRDANSQRVIIEPIEK